MKHDVVWSAVDNLAKKNNISPSKMAKLVGLDATTFNKSKRFRIDGKKRWPSLNSINKLLSFFNISFDEFYGVSMFNNFSTLPIINYSEVNCSIDVKKEDMIFNNTDEMGEETLQNLDFAIVLDTKKFDPIYKYNSTIIISKSPEIRRGDRVLIVKKDKKIYVYEFISCNNNSYEFISLEKYNQKEEINSNEILSIKRIVWASQ
ncbi:MAG: hypothetical protein R3Y43_02975 [Alphaproteobacteria bacterium]